MRIILSAIGLLAVVAGAGAAGCSSSESGASDAKLTVVATTTQVADLVRNVGGDRVDVHGILGTGADPHEYEPRPSDVAAIAGAPVVFKSGGDVDTWLDDLIENAGGDHRVVTLIDSVHRIEDEHGDPDPHWWADPGEAIRAVAAIRDGLIKADPTGRPAYERGARAYVGKLEALDREIDACMRRVPVDERKLVTTHDALGYFADRYGVEVVGALIPSLSTQAQPSARDINDLVEQIREEGVEAIFPETALNKRLESAVSREAGAEVGGQLWTDALSPEGSGAETYLEAMRKNAETMAKGMSGGTVSCSAH